MNSVNIRTPEGKIRLTYPSRYDEITLDQLLKIEKLKETDPLTLFSILTGMDLAFAEGLTDKIEPLVWDAVAFLFDEQLKWDNLGPRSHFIIDGKAYKVPRPQDILLGQSIMVTQALTSSNTMFDVVPQVLAIYFEPLVSGQKFNRDNLPGLKEKILKSSAVEAMAVASFFLFSPRNWQIIIKHGLPLLERTLLLNSLTMVRSTSTASSC